MKVRSGFVSNSSSSSFVVQRLEDDFNVASKKILSEEQEKVLKEAGFILSMAYYPHQVDMHNEADPEEFPLCNWVREVTCNQEDEIHVLLTNRISFMAEIHYEHYTMIYDGPSDKLLIAQNLGKQAEMNGTNKVDFEPWKKVPPLERTTGTEYLKKHPRL